MESSGETQAASAPIIKLDYSGLSRFVSKFWLSAHMHVAFWVVFGAIFLSLYLTLHFASFLTDPYQREATEKLAIAAKLYQVQLNNDTGKYELLLEGEPYDLTADDAGPLGVGKMVTTKGVLTGVLDDIEEYNKEVEEFVQDFIANFRAVPGLPNTYERGLSNLMGTEYIAYFGDDNIDPVIRIQLSDATQLRQIPASETGLRIIRRIIEYAQIFDKSKQEYASEAGALLKSIKVDVANNTVEKMLRNVESGVKEVTPKLSSKNITLEKQASSVTSIEVVNNYFKTKLETIKQTLLPSEKKTEIKLSNKTGDDTVIEVAQFQKDIVNVAADEISFFWTFGHMVWFEVILLTWLGVLTEGMTRLGVSYVGRHDGSIWNPRESIRTILKLVYAPALSIVVIWTIFFTNLVEFESRVGEGRSVYFVPVAFILGLFPNLGYSLLKKLAEAIFGETSIAKKSKRKSTVLVKETGTLPVDSSKAPNFDETKEKAKRHALAPLSS